MCIRDSVYAKRHQLTAREQEVLDYILRDQDNQNIASSMSLSPSTVKMCIRDRFSPAKTRRSPSIYIYKRRGGHFPEFEPGEQASHPLSLIHI